MVDSDNGQPRNDGDHLQEPALSYARQDFPIIRDSLTVGEALNIIRREGVGERIIYFYIINELGQLTGVVPTRRLLTSMSHQPISDSSAMSFLCLKDIGQAVDAKELAGVSYKPIVFLGFFREASAILHEFELEKSQDQRHTLLDDVLVIDFNPEVYSELRRRGIASLYGDVAHMETLHHAKVFFD